MLFHEKENMVIPSKGIVKYSFNPSKHKYSFNLSGNIKIGNIASFSTLMGDYIYNGMDKELKDIKGTCKNCSCCKKSCYVRASYRFPSVIHSQAINTWGMRNELDKVEMDLAEQIEKLNIKIVRLNQSGELENEEQFAMWCRLAEHFNNVKFYIYTKMYSIVEPFLKKGLVTSNFTINYSIWHDVGVKEFKNVEKYQNVKAFIYDDGINLNLNPVAYCPAYTKPNGEKKAKMNHNITCEKCRLCIDKKIKIIGCLDH